MSLDLNIASLRVRLTPQEGMVLVLGERFSAFTDTGQGDPVVILHVFKGNPDIPSGAEKVFDARLFDDSNNFTDTGEPFWEVLHYSDKVYLKIQVKNPDREMTLEVNPGGNPWRVFTGCQETNCDPLPYPVDGLFLYFLVTYCGGLMIHGSAAVSSGRGWLFTGRSGSGKTTLARIFDSSGDRVIHDDRLILLKGREGWMVHSTPVYRNDEPRSVLLDHIWIISHGASNVSVPVTGVRAAGLVLANCIQQNWDREAAAMHMSVVEDIISSVKVSSLAFVPDKTIRDYLAAHEEGSMKMGYSVAATLLNEKKPISIRAGGYSMWPAIRPGDKVVIEPVAAALPGKGDIVALVRDGGFVVHRITDEEVRGGERYFKTQGDASLNPDRWSSEDEIAGVVKEIIRAGKRRRVSRRRCPSFLNHITALIGQVTTPGR